MGKQQPGRSRERQRTPVRRESRLEAVMLLRLGQKPALQPALGPCVRRSQVCKRRSRVGSPARIGPSATLAASRETSDFCSQSAQLCAACAASSAAASSHVCRTAGHNPAASLTDSSNPPSTMQAISTWMLAGKRVGVAPKNEAEGWALPAGTLEFSAISWLLR